MRLTKYRIFWMPLFVVFVFEKLWSEKHDPVQIVVAFLFFSISVFWFIVPYVLGLDIRVPGYTDILKKGSDDNLRLVYFVVGVIGYIGSLIV